MSAAALAGAVALVTGASRGLGAAVALALGALGAHLVLLARTEGGLAETDDALRAQGASATLLPIDLAEGEKVDAIGPSLFARFGRLDILVHAAGALGRMTPVAHLLEPDYRRAMAVNAEASWRLIRTTDPLLHAAPAGRAVAFTTKRAREPLAYWASYGASKAALEHFFLSWAGETRQTRLRINLVDPGAVTTRLHAEAWPGIDPASLPQPADLAPAIAALCLPSETRHGEIVRLGREAGQSGLAVC